MVNGQSPSEFPVDVQDKAWLMVVAMVMDAKDWKVAIPASRMRFIVEQADRMVIHMTQHPITAGILLGVSFRDPPVEQQIIIARN